VEDSKVREHIEPFMKHVKFIEMEPKAFADICRKTTVLSDKEKIEHFICLAESKASFTSHALKTTDTMQIRDSSKYVIIHLPNRYQNASLFRVIKATSLPICSIDFSANKDVYLVGFKIETVEQANLLYNSEREFKSSDLYYHLSTDNKKTYFPFVEYFKYKGEFYFDLRKHKVMVLKGTNIKIFLENISLLLDCNECYHLCEIRIKNEDLEIRLLIGDTKVTFCRLLFQPIVQL
jgi:hypothetical protein